MCFHKYAVLKLWGAPHPVITTVTKIMGGLEPPEPPPPPPPPPHSYTYVIEHFVSIGFKNGSIYFACTADVIFQWTVLLSTVVFRLLATGQWAAEAVTWSNSSSQASWLVSLVTWPLLQAASNLKSTVMATVLFRLLATCRSGHVTKLTNQLAWELEFDHVTAYCSVASTLKSTVQTEGFLYALWPLSTLNFCAILCCSLALALALSSVFPQFSCTPRTTLYSLFSTVLCVPPVFLYSTYHTVLSVLYRPPPVFLYSLYSMYYTVLYCSLSSFLFWTTSSCVTLGGHRGQ